MTSKLAFHHSFIAALVPIVLAAVGTTPARAQGRPEANPTAPQDPYDSADDPDDADEADEAAPPGSAAPLAERPAPPVEQPSPPPASPPPVQVQPGRPAQPAQPAPPASSGQWVYTQQYGWLWMPYGDQYVSSAEGAYPYEYVYRPTYGWTWLTAPWVWGWGPRIYFSIGGPRHYAWFHNHWYPHRGFAGHGVIRGPAFHGGFRGHGSSGHFGGRGGHGHR
jgi:hypothetical protein